MYGIHQTGRKQKQLQTSYKQVQQDVIFRTEQLKKVVQVDSISITNLPLKKIDLQTISIEDNLGLLYLENSKGYYKALTKKEKQNLLPDLSAEYFQGTNSSLNETVKGFQFGVKIPFLFGGLRSKIKAAKIAEEIVNEQQLDYKTKLNAEYKSLLAKLQQYKEAINYYDSQGKSLSEEIIKTANRTFKEGEIDFFQYIQSLETAKEIQLDYLEHLNLYNQTIITINYLIL